MCQALRWIWGLSPHLEALKDLLGAVAQPEPLTLNLEHLSLLVIVEAMSCRATTVTFSWDCCSGGGGVGSLHPFVALAAPGTCQG